MEADTIILLINCIFFLFESGAQVGFLCFFLNLLNMVVVIDVCI